ncbi:MAG TPA: hypothetical protein VI431_16645, partial [Candidatus Acidoferrum sp.]
RGAQEKAGDDRKVERRVFAAVNYVAGQFSQAEGELVAKVQKSADKNEEGAKENKRTAEMTQRIHRLILPEAAESLPGSAFFIDLHIPLDS